MARAHEFVLCLVPWNHTSQVSANCIDAEVFYSDVSGDEVSCISLQALHKLSITWLVIGFPSLESHIVAKSIFSHLAPTAASRRGRHEKVEVRSSDASDCASNSC